MTRKIRMNKLQIVSLVLILCSILLPVAAAASPPPPSCTGNTQDYGYCALSSNLSLVLLVVLMIIVAAGFVYLLSGIIDSPTARNWARAQIYEAILIIILIIGFMALVYVFTYPFGTSTSIVGLYSGSELIGNGDYNAFFCTGAYSGGSCLPGYTGPGGGLDDIYGCQGESDLFTIASCDVARFSAFTYNIFEAIYYGTLYMSIAPGFGINWQVQLNGKNAKNSRNLAISGGMSIPSIIPIAAETSFAAGFSGLLLFMFLNQVQVLLISGSVLFLSVLLALGLIARAFGFTRTFGGALIALGLGLGFIYPLMTSITYGYVDYAISHVSGSTYTVLTSGEIGVDMINWMFAVAGSCILSFASSCNIFTGNFLTVDFPQIAAAISGLTFIPFINFTVVDAFIVDFSKAIGERLDFMSILSGVV